MDIPRSDQGLQKTPLKLRNGQRNTEISALDSLDDGTDSLTLELPPKSPTTVCCSKQRTKDGDLHAECVPPGQTI